MNKGDVISIQLSFTDLTGNKLRPAVVLIISNNDLIVCFITTQLQWKETTDIVLRPSAKIGIKKKSLFRLSKIATIDKYLAVGKLGVIQQNEMTELNMKLIFILQLVWNHIICLFFWFTLF